jgi:hypothetical protein
MLLASFSAMARDRDVSGSFYMRNQAPVEEKSVSDAGSPEHAEKPARETASTKVEEEVEVGEKEVSGSFDPRY